VPEHIVTDPQRLRQILKNLLTNAFKFTERGKVQVQVSLAGDGWDPRLDSLAKAPSVVSFSVTDTGIGIGEAEQQRIFEAFAQGDGTTARQYGGTGLGLSISRELAGLLGGEITLTSTPGEGSAFTVYLPLSESATAPDAGPPASSTAATNGHGAENGNLASRSLEGVKVLVVDDDSRNVFALTALLERANADVHAAESGADAIAALGRAPGIDVVLMDIMMPVMDGYAAIRTIRDAEGPGEHRPIIAVTGKVVIGERQRCIEAGADDYVPKPVDVAALLRAIGPWLPAAAQSTG
jgi:CheY-like chemotaxis protein